jgi:hypothetical protein
MNPTNAGVRISRRTNFKRRLEMTRLAASLAAVAFATLASVGHAADSVTSRAINQDVSNVQGRAAPTAAAGSRIGLRVVSDVSTVYGRSSQFAHAGSAQLGAMLDLNRFGRA